MSIKFTPPKLTLIHKLLITLAGVTLLNFIIRPRSPIFPPAAPNVKTSPSGSTLSVPIQNTPEPVPIRYFLRNTTIKEPVSWLFWPGPESFYLIGNRIVSGSTLETVFTFPPNFQPLHSPHSSFVSASSKNQVIAYNPTTKEKLTLNYNSNTFYSPSFTRKIIFSNQKLEIFRQDNLITTFDLSNRPDSIVWSKSENLFATIQDKSIAIYNISSHLFYQIFAQGKPIQVEFSPNGLYLAISETKSLKLYSTQKGDLSQTASLDPETEKIVFSWGTSEKIFLFEKRFQPRERDYVYLYDPQTQSKFRVTESLGIPTRINFNVFPVSTSDTAVMFLNNAKHPWVATTQTQHSSQLNTPQSHED